MCAPRFASLATGLFIVLFGLVLLFAGCVRKASPLSDGQIYSNSIKNFTVTFPQGWTTSETVAPVGNPNTGTTPTTTTGAVDTTAQPPVAGAGTAVPPTTAATTSAAPPAATTPTVAPAPAAATKPGGDITATTTKTTASATMPGKDGTTAASTSPASTTATTPAVPPFVVVTAVNGKTSGSLPETIFVKVEDLPYELSYDEYFLSSLDKLGDIGVSAFKENQRIDFQGNYAVKAIFFDCQKNGVAAKGCSYVFMSGKRGCILTGLAPAKSFGGCQKAFDRVAASFAWK